MAALGCILIYLKRKHDKAAWAAHDGLSVYSGRSEKVPPFPSLGGPGGGGGALKPTGLESGLAPPPQGAYYASDANGRLHLVMGYPSQQDVEAGYAQQPTPPPLSPSPGAVNPMTAPPGTLPEPVRPFCCLFRSIWGPESSCCNVAPGQMDDSEEVASPAISARGRIQTPLSSDRTVIPEDDSDPMGESVSRHFEPIPEREAVLGSEGLADPASFSPQRRTSRAV